MSIRENMEILRVRIDRAAARVERTADEIAIVAVAKTFPTESIEEALACGVRIIGENRVQEATKKHAVIGDKVDWHMVGHLQTNKVKDALKMFTMIQSLDSLRLAQEIEKRAVRKVPCLIEVNTSGERTKFGLSVGDVSDFYGKIAAFTNVDIQGFMTIGPGWAVDDPEASRACFRLLRGLQEELSQEYDRPFPILSMGMTSDFEVAIEEGSTMIRIGTAIFGSRK